MLALNRGSCCQRDCQGLFFLPPLPTEALGLQQVYMVKVPQVIQIRFRPLVNYGSKNNYHLKVKSTVPTPLS